MPAPIFIGRHTPEVIGDYVGGSNHVLPTARSARFSSGLSVLDFVKRTSILRLGPEQLRDAGPAAIALAEGPKGLTPMRDRSRSASISRGEAWRRATSGFAMSSWTTRSAVRRPMSSMSAPSPSSI
jgi:hypothetical protein